VAGWPAFRARFPGLLAADVATLYGRRCTGTLYGVSVSRTTLFELPGTVGLRRAIVHRGGHAA
jgi:hypothetical protein